MAEEKSQSYSNHTKYDPVFHFFLIPVTMANLFISTLSCYRHPSLDTGWIVAISFTALVAVFKMRIYSLKVQDRVIRLEERLRLSQLVNSALRARIPELTEGQLIALRFASDSEAPGLAEKALAGGLAPKDIKKSVTSWRPDYFRI